jgi:thiosulfate dehydrogenase [quinone] large subunit
MIMTATVAQPLAATDTTAGSPARLAGRHWLAVARIGVGFIFLWAFLDKMFGLGYSTPSAKAWIVGGSPTSGFLGHVSSGPMREFFNSLAGSGLVDILFMLGMLAVGVGLIFGVALRASAVTATLIMVLMYLAEWPLAQTTFDGQPAGSTNPLVDYHLIYALVAILAACLAAGRTWGLGRIWESTSLVKRLPWLK